jgi:hypothetical protein
MAPELLLRYGRQKDCTWLQIKKTADDLQTAEDTFPYLCAAFMAETDWRSFQATIQNVNWEEVRNRTDRLVFELSKKSATGNFYESGIGIQGLFIK